ncbi:hypothetical protein OHB26_33190 [Nocardia sp. NBC_01503]|uniref:hypothetical protein n=1 Tax=Nocardia sp. NBC_01503 TaxID=2975997 RepID=UPI002E7BA20C|nr:hypothetical protein [Nocardia sp. NBC_01503]WTL31711.1 hypothetical protein OHB26_33190 [Nocardia sp. NBC_01503]
MSAPTTPNRFVLWREVLFAYLAPAVCAGAGGLVTAQPSLLLAAATSIAGTSALVALLLGAWLRHNGSHHDRLLRFGPVTLAAGFGLTAGTLAAVTAQLLTATTTLPDRLRLDLPIAAALAATILTWRWRTTQRKALA